ncbi:MAG: hypothetical protein K8T25_05235 [Planctomycetia bacterium]|nr:hypothetical protein [Planctomycetia bacterium]
MVASRIRCIVVEIPAGNEMIEHRLRAPARELLPWADPYIAGLIRKLQDEVREERAEQHRTMAEQMRGRRGFAEGRQHVALGAEFGEAPPPAISSPIEFETPSDQDWPLLQDRR